jgi:3-hydroxyacyl-CoA dehydrogenase / enoyl-CoA hydratase / 3-hydroxybutyryl-CoA epimerase
MAVESISAVRSGITTTVDEQGTATITIDQPDSKVNLMNQAFVEELAEAVDSLQRDLAGVIVGSGKDGQFFAGADLKQLLQATRPEDVMELTRSLQRSLNRLASLPYPSVAAINGPALGGGLELALACDYRVCIESDDAMLGAPEVQLGLLPAGGGCQRLPRLAGLSRALALILEGKRINPRRAKQYGIVDEVVHPSILTTSARAWLTRGKRQLHPDWSRLDMAAERWPMVRSLMYRWAARTIQKKSGSHYPAPVKALDAIRAGQEQGFGAGLAAESVAFSELVTGPVARNLIEVFFATEGLKKEQRALKPEARPVDRVGIVGAGFMGAGIAQAAASARYGVRLRDVAPEQVARGLKTARDLTLSAAHKSRFSRQEARDIVSRLSGTTDYSGFRRAELVIEAVFEDIEVKRTVIAELEEVIAPETIIASNTSSLPIGSLAAQAKHPERIVGMHFFSPVHKMPLLEVIRGERTSEQAVATAVEVGRSMGKTVIVVQDGPGFYTTRVLGALMREAGYLFEQGASIEAIDGAMTAFGFPVGPLALLDEVGIDVAAHVAELLERAFGERFRQSGSINRLTAAGRLGRKSGSGFYDYRHKRKRPDRRVYALREALSQPFPRDLIQRRLVLSLVNEAILCLDEKVIESARDGDIGAIMGFGFPPFLGGPFRYADREGLQSIAEQLQKMAFAYGPRFAPAPMLERLASTGGHFSEEPE